MASYRASVIADAAALERLLPEWTALFYAARTPNPFAHPLWSTTWARHFIAPAQLYVVAVRDEAGALVGVAPYYRRRHALAGRTAATSVHLLGTARHEHLTELPQALIAPGLERPVWRAIIGCLCGRAAQWDWLEVSLPPEQGWFEPEWLPREGPGAGAMVVHKATRPCVVLPLPRCWDELRAGLKRNVKESLRRGANSLARAGHTWRPIAPAAGDRAALDAALDGLVGLHRARAGLAGKVCHPDCVADPSDRAFLYDVAHRLFDAGHLTPHVLHVDGAPAAARLLLHANGATFFSFSGFAPAWWPYNVATTLVAECLRAAIARGDTIANLSPGPDVAKLRWSERLELHQEFIVVGPRRRSRLAFGAFWQLRAAAVARRARARSGVHP